MPNSNEDFEGSSTSNYPSSHVIYSTFKEEYDYEINRIQKIDTKINIGITFCSALFIFILDFFDFSQLTLKLKNDITLQLTFNIYFTIWVILCLSYVGAFVSLLLIIRSRKYYHINVDELFTKNMHKFSVDISEMFIAGRYKNAIAINRKINNKRMKVFNISLLLIFIVIICSVLLTFVNHNLFK